MSLGVILILGIFLRIILNNFEPSPDALSFVIWAKYLTTHRLADLYEYLPDGYLAYPPLYYYVLMVLGRIMNIFNVWQNTWLSLLIVKIPVFAADVGSTLIIFKLTKTLTKGSHALIAAGFYFLNPAIIYVTSVWGQIDSIIIFLGLLVVGLLANKRLLLAWITFVMGLLVKLQMLAVLPLLLVSIFPLNIHKLFKYLVILMPISLVPFLPLIFSKGLVWTGKYFAIMPNQYPYTSVYAYNLWAPWGFIVSDKLKLFGFFEIRILGILLFILAAVVVCWPWLHRKMRPVEAYIYAAFLLWFAFAFFPSRIHSRYLIYSLGLFAPFFPRFPMYGILLTFLMCINLLLPSNNMLFSVTVKYLNQPANILLFTGFAATLWINGLRIYFRMFRSQGSSGIG